MKNISNQTTMQHFVKCTGDDNLKGGVFFYAITFFSRFISMSSAERSTSVGIIPNLFGMDKVILFYVVDQVFCGHPSLLFDVRGVPDYHCFMCISSFLSSTAERRPPLRYPKSSCPVQPATSFFVFI